MRHPSRSVRSLAAAFATLAASAGLLVAGGAGAAQAAPSPLPAHVFAPYFEAYSSDSPADLAQKSGAKYLTMAFVQTEAKGSCTPYWNGSTGQPIASSVFGADFATIRSRGGDVIPSFGGYAADNGGTEIADSCTSVDSIAAAYQKVITTYDVTRLDMDIEDNSLTNKAGIDRRNQAIRKVQDWAAAGGRPLQVSYTLPTTTGGLASSGLAVLKSAKTAGAQVDIVNLMTFDYYDGAAHDMANDTKSAASRPLRPARRALPGQDARPAVGHDRRHRDARHRRLRARRDLHHRRRHRRLRLGRRQGRQHPLLLGAPAGQRGCPGTGGSDTCSGIAQDPWYFTRTFAPFTRGGGPVADDFSVSVAPGSATVAPGAGTTATVSTRVTSGAAQPVALTVTGAPAGVTASVAPGSVTAGGTARLTVGAAASAAPGTYALTVTGTGGGALSHSAGFTLTVSGPGGGSGALVNGGLESGSLAPWTCESGGAVVTSPVHGGTYALQGTPSADRTGECAQSLTLAPNTAYTLSGWVQGSYAYLGVRGGANASTWTSSTGWTKLTVPFTTGASGAVTVYLHGWYGQGAVRGDDFAVN